MRTLFILSLVILSGCDLFTNSKPKYEVYEVYGASSGPLHAPWIRGMGEGLYSGGYKTWLNTPGWNDQLTITERSLKVKSDGLIVHLPFGWDESGDFDFAGYTQSKKDPRLKNLVDIPSFISAWQEYLKATGYKKIWFYYGYVGAQPSIWNGLSDDHKKDLIKQNLEPLYALKEAVKSDGVTIGILVDVLSAFTDPTNPNWSIAYPMIKEMGLAVGGEPWPNKDMPELKNKNFTNVFLGASTWLFDPDFDTTSGQWNTWSAKQSNVVGPLMSWVWQDWANGASTETIETYTQKVIYSLKKYKSVAIYQQDPAGKSAADWKELAAADGKACLTQHNVTDCCETKKGVTTCAVQ